MKRLFSDPACMQLILDGEDEFGPAKTPWTSVYTLEAISKKVGIHGTTEQKLWIIASVHAGTRNGDIERSMMSIRQFTGKGQPNNKGLCDLLLYKLEMKKHALYYEYTSRTHQLTRLERTEQQIYLLFLLLVNAI